MGWASYLWCMTLKKIFQLKKMQVATRFLDMPVGNMGNAENLYEKLASTLM